MRRRDRVPGCIFMNNGRYWRRVQLPGEETLRARPLVPAGGRFATDDLGMAEQVARDMYARAVFAAGATAASRRRPRDERPRVLTMAALVRECIGRSRATVRSASPTPTPNSTRP
jgi:hypothetical protein